MINSLKLKNFRSFTDLEINFTSPQVFLVGPNGIGKTNILESIYFASIGKSFRAINKNLVKYSQNTFIIREQNDNNKTIIIKYSINPLRKNIIVNNTPRNINFLQSINPLVLFHNADTTVFAGSSERRRNLADIVLLQTNQMFSRAYRTYSKLLRHRNALLLRYKKNIISLPQLQDQLFVIDIQMTAPAGIITTQRSSLFNQILPLVNEYYYMISGQKNSININFNSSHAENFTDKLANVKNEDIRRGYSTVGPHRDDILVQLNNHNVDEAASAGEIRSLILAFKKAQLFMLQQAGTTPLLLLDDVFSELDLSRRKLLLKDDILNQVFITTTDLSGIDTAAGQIINVEELAA